jgi:rRNA-processing protein FCF1
MTAGNGASLHNGPGDGSGSGPQLTVIVDGANVVGSRPDGWWRDRAGAAVRLHDELAKLAVRGAAGIPAEQLATDGDRGPGSPGAVTVAVVLVLEGAARAAGPRIAERARVAAQTAPRAADVSRPGEGGAGTVQVVSAPGSGDDEIARLAQARPGRRIVVTADRELRRRCLAVGAQVAGPSWLYALL